ncbi:uncharacterized protein LOC121182940 [Toxotes jaculatrix]|uniref:uncharacterized protein LOC121182940 n=1 Tax=Toxotes jaculatrix TaxID=941984 RepID=UPI001B3AF651|nr:uncharacterized protein LOC121182940 [Toxotes jaculatrix]
MDLVVLFTLCLCWWTTAARSTWSNKPSIIVSSHEIVDGETLTVSCTVPIDYTGGDCRLFREHSTIPIKLKTTSNYICHFHLSSQVLLGKQRVGSRISIWCDYTIQEYTSVPSDRTGIVVWGSSPSPGLSVSHHFISPDDSVEITCSPPLRFVSSCHFYRDEVAIARGSCRRNMTGRELSVWEKPSLLLPVNLTCRYRPDQHRYIRSEPSNHSLVVVVDVSRTTSSVDCSVSVTDEHLETFSNSSWTFGGGDGPKVTVQLTNGSLVLNQTCNDRP